MEEQKRALAYLCPRCRQSVIMERTVFRLASAPDELPCPCGGSRLRVEPEGAYADLTVPCMYCGRDHRIRCPAHAFLREKALAFSCQATGLDCLYVGTEDAVFRAMRRLEEAAARMREKEDDGAILNEPVMTEVLGELREIAERGGIACVCGAKRYRLTVRYSSVELECAECGTKTRIPAATGEDLEDLCCRQTLTIGERGGV